MHEFAIAAVGMSTALGRDAATSCAAFRAGISRRQDLDYFDYFSDDDAELVLVQGHPAYDRALECEGLGKMVFLGIDALKDLFAKQERPLHEDTGRIGLFLALPNYSLRQEAFVDVNAALASSRFADDVLAEEQEGDGNPLLSLQFASECNEHLVRRLFRASGVDANFTLHRNIYGGHTGYLLCIREAMQAIRSRKVDRCIVGAIDSFLESDSLEWALDQGRLKLASSPCGFSPGEAAVFIELVAGETVAHSTSAVVYISEPEIIGNQGESEYSLEFPGLGLTHAIEGVISRALPSAIDLTIGNLNGEHKRALEWGFAINRLAPKFPSLDSSRLWLPAEGFGETGCASSGLAIGVGVEALRRRYAFSDTILVWSASEDGASASLLLQSEET